MKGIYQIIETFNDETAKAVLGEDIIQTDDESGSMVYHEIHLTVGRSKPLIVWASEIDSIINVLQQAKDLAETRTDQLFAEDEVLSPA